MAELLGLETKLDLEQLQRISIEQIEEGGNLICEMVLFDREGKELGRRRLKETESGWKGMSKGSWSDNVDEYLEEAGGCLDDIHDQAADLFMRGLV